MYENAKITRKVEKELKDRGEDGREDRIERQNR